MKKTWNQPDIEELTIESTACYHPPVPTPIVNEMSSGDDEEESDNSGFGGNGHGNGNAFGHNNGHGKGHNKGHHFGWFF
ncbi:MAG: hypothetical protein K6F84_04935 [Lachnospiraceae bacterium]|nr:hypothetical protein [Lachnospiraceae bacterium]